MARLVVIVMLMIAWSAWAEAVKIGPKEALERARDGEITIVDIRLPFEWAKTGLPEPAIGISLQDETLQPRPGFLDDLLALVEGDRGRPIALICASGSRSDFAQKLLSANGFTALYNITEGVTGGPNGPGWLKRSLPIKPCTTC